MAVHFATKYKTIGFDLKQSIVDNSLAHKNPTSEVSTEEFQKATYFIPTTDLELMSDADIIVVAVPTPIDKDRCPDLFPVESASRTVGKVMKKGCNVHSSLILKKWSHFIVL